MRLLAWAVSAVLALGCSSAESGEALAGAGGAEPGPSCDGRGMPVVAGRVLGASGGLEVALSALTPEVPVVGDNVWELRLARDGERVAGASLGVVPWMPDHRHASTKVVQVDETEPGTYRLAPIYLGMLGYWEVGVDAAVGDETLGSFSIDFCVGSE